MGIANFRTKNNPDNMLKTDRLDFKTMTEFTVQIATRATAFMHAAVSFLSRQGNFAFFVCIAILKFLNDDE
jgi:hypothetical protein